MSKQSFTDRENEIRKLTDNLLGGIRIPVHCRYGSKRHMMTEIFNNSSKPFYRFGDIIMLAKIDRERWISYICESFSETGKVIGTESCNTP